MTLVWSWKKLICECGERDGQAFHQGVQDRKGTPNLDGPIREVEDNGRACSEPCSEVGQAHSILQRAFPSLATCLYLKGVGSDTPTPTYTLAIHTPSVDALTCSSGSS